VSTPTPISMWMVEFAAGLARFIANEVERWCCAQHRRRNQQGVKDRYRAAGSVGEQVLNWPWPGDHERNDAETYRMERESYWLLGPVWAPGGLRTRGDSSHARRRHSLPAHVIERLVPRAG
jgi:hypothetical protein